MHKIIATLIVIFLALSYMYVGGFGRIAPYAEEVAERKVPHHAKDRSQLIEHIDVVALYFVPKDRVGRTYLSWKEPLEKALGELTEFHRLQTAGKSSISFHVIPNPVIGERDAQIYDVPPVKHGNAEALFAVSSEIKKRVEHIDGDLYDPLIKADSGDYRVYILMYEGEGASGALNTALLSSSFFKNKSYENINSTILAHEFYHTLGLEDQYELTSLVLAEDAVLPRSIPHSSDIMGLGILSPISDTYISQSLISNIGI
jgi:hypothetical protein